MGVTRQAMGPGFVGRTPYGEVHLVFVAWVSMLGSDILIHGGFLHAMYLEPHPFLLSPERAFRLIPLGYLSFLILAALLVWLATRLETRGFAAGAKLGLVLGGAIWASMTVGLLSVTTAPMPLMSGWFVGQTLALGIAGGVVGAARGGVYRRKLWARVLGWCGGALVLAVLLQNLT